MKIRFQVVCWMVLAATQAAGQGRPQTKGKAMSTTEFDRLLEAGDSKAIDIAQQYGPAAISAIEPHLKSPKHLTRLTAIECLDVAGGPQAQPLLIGALRDANEQVRMNAMMGLERNLPYGYEAQLLRAWDTNATRDGYVRHHIPMLLGKMQASHLGAQLLARMPTDKRQEVHDGLIAGAAKLGEPTAREMIGGLLRDARGARTAEVIELVKYLDDPWVIPYLVPVLDRREIAVDLSSHRKTLKRRECDLAVDEVMRISRAQFSFAMNPLSQYRDEQIAEVRNFAAAYGR